jgi:VanZ family protein
MLAKLIQSRWTAMVWTLIIFLLMIMPPNRIPNQGLFGIKHLDKVVHICLFGGFVWLWFMSRINSQKTSDKKGILARIFLISTLYGIAMEFVQYFFTDRDFDIWDIAADIIGAAIAWVLLSLFVKKVSPYGNRGRNQN